MSSSDFVSCLSLVYNPIKQSPILIAYKSCSQICFGPCRAPFSFERAWQISGGQPAQTIGKSDNWVTPTKTTQWTCRNGNNTNRFFSGTPGCKSAVIAFRWTNKNLCLHDDCCKQNITDILWLLFIVEKKQRTICFGVSTFNQAVFTKQIEFLTFASKVEFAKACLKCCAEDTWMTGPVQRIPMKSNRWLPQKLHIEVLGPWKIKAWTSSISTSFLCFRCWIILGEHSYSWDLQHTSHIPCFWTNEQLNLNLQDVFSKKPAVVSLLASFS